MINAIDGIRTQFQPQFSNSNVENNDNRPKEVILQEEVDTQKEEQDKKELEAELVDLSKQLNDEMRQMGTDLRFNYNDALPGLTVTIKERETEKVIREIPSKEAIELMKKMRDIVGIIFDKQA